MLIRALIVVLAMLNGGVALWWLSQGDPEPVALPAPRPGVATLELLPMPADAPAARPAPDTGKAAEPDAPPSPAATPRTPTPPKPAVTAPTPVAAEPAPPAAQCLTLGPFADRDAAQVAIGRAGEQAVRSRLRETKDESASRYRVLLPPAPSREEAQATVKRIAAAGITDYYVIGQGDEAHAIALGQYRNREGAERRMAALAEAGFKAQLVASGGTGQSEWWVDARLADGSTAAGVRQQSGASRQRSLDCAQLR